MAFMVPAPRAGGHQLRDPFSGKSSSFFEQHCDRLDGMQPFSDDSLCPNELSREDSGHLPRDVSIALAKLLALLTVPRVQVTKTFPHPELHDHQSRKVRRHGEITFHASPRAVTFPIRVFSAAASASRTQISSRYDCLDRTIFAGAENALLPPPLASHEALQ